MIARGELITGSSFYETFSQQQLFLADYCQQRFKQEELGRLPSESRPGIVSLLDKNFTNLFGAHRVLGGYLAPWIGITLGVKNTEIIKKASYASFLGRFWFILFDHQMDEPDIISRLNIESAIDPLFQLALFAYHEVVPEIYHTSFNFNHQRLLNESQQANQWEVSRRGFVYTPYSIDDLHLVGGKIAVVSWTGYALAFACSEPEIGIDLEEVIKNLCIAIQLNHDITDAAEDFEMRNCTFPLSLAFELLGFRNGDQITESDKVLEVIYSQVCLSKLLETVRFFSEIAIEAALKFQDSPFINHLSTMIERNKQLLEDIELINNPDERKSIIIERLKRNQGHPEKHAISLE